MSERGWGGMPKLSKLAKINLSWGIIITSGLATFVIARDQIQAERRERMKLKRKIEEQVQKERLEDLAVRETTRTAEKKQ